MSNIPSRAVFGLCLLLSLTSCGGGGGGGKKPPAPAPSSAAAGSSANGNASQSSSSVQNDADGDGIGDNADPTPLGEIIPSWPMFQGSATHIGWVDVTLAPENFKQRWTKPMNSGVYLQGVAGDGHIFVRSGGSVQAIDARNGETIWSRTVSETIGYFENYLPTYADGIVYVEGDNTFWAFNAADGTAVFSQPVIAPSGASAVVVGGTIYTARNNQYFEALDAKTGERRWWQSMPHLRFAGAVTDTSVILYSDTYAPQLNVLDRLSGNVSFTIANPSEDTFWGVSTTPVVSGNYALVNDGRQLLAFDLVARKLAWTAQAQSARQPAVVGDRVYIVNDRTIEVRSLTEGKLLSSIINSRNRPFSPEFLVTNNLVFVCDDVHVYAYGLDGTLAWTLPNKTGRLTMAEGALIITAESEVTAIDVQGDIDADGLPDWWENRFVKNLNPAEDLDGDGLTGIEEFTLRTHPLKADTDGDGLSDAEEVKDYKTSPLKADSEGDGLNDFEEVRTHRTDPLKVDTDGDSLTDAEEVAAGLNPNSAEDALADNDGDGFTNTHELRADTDFNDAKSYPALTGWTSLQGNNRRSNYTPMLLDDARFSERWTISTYRSLQSPVTTRTRLITRDGEGRYSGWDAGTGAEIWKLTIANIMQLTTAGERAVYFAGPNSAAMRVINTVTGATELDRNLDVSFTDPLIDGERVYARNYNGGATAYHLTTGDRLWQTARSETHVGSDPRFLVGKGQLIGVKSGGLEVFSSENGNLISTFPFSEGYALSAALTSRQNVVIQTQQGQLFSINVATGERRWVNQECPAHRMAVGNGKVYVVSQTRLCVIDERTGMLSWTLSITNQGYISNLVLTASHLFYSDSVNTYGINLATKTATWSIARGGPELAMGEDGTLFIVGNALTAIDTEGDTDADGLLQWWERRFGGDLLADADLDGDGLTNLQEFSRKTNPLVADTDGDGLSDGQEVNTTLTDPLLADTDKDGLSDGVEVGTHGTNPLRADSDSDGIDDAREIAAGLSPTNGEDADEDADGDGFSNRDEVFSGSSPNDATSRPTPGDWETGQANSARNGFQAYRLDEANFALRWTKTYSLPITQIATGDGKVFFAQGSSHRKLVAAKAVDGNEHWTQELGQVSGQAPPSYHAGQVVIAYDKFRRFDAHTGAARTATVIENGGGHFWPLFVQGIAYLNTGYGYLTAYNMDTGARVWAHTTENSLGTLVANDQSVFFGGNREVRAADRLSGAITRRFDNHYSGYANLALGSRNNILLADNGIKSFDMNSGHLHWEASSGKSVRADAVALANGQVYYVEDGTLVSVDEVTGQTRWTGQPTEQYFDSNLVATLSHVFVSSANKTYAFSADDGELLWTYNAGGQLALGTDGALYIQSARQLTAISLEGDSDGDGMPDWWERLYGLDPANAADAALDLDADGLTNLEEFMRKTYADKADSDGDGLSDLDELSIHNTQATNADSDGDGIHDGWEIINSLDPLDAMDRDLDTDGDGIPNYFEFQMDTDPNNTLSAPPLFTPGTYSFEDARLPDGWSLSADTTDVSINLAIASHGIRSLQLRNKVDIRFSGFFAASDLSIDVKSDCEYYNTWFEIYVDDNLMASAYTTTQWAALKTVIPMGMHTVSLRTNNSPCTLYMDKVVIEPAKTNTELGLQLVGLENNSLRFFDAGKRLARSINVVAPIPEVQPVSLATIGNEKIVILFNGVDPRVGVLDLSTFNWRYFGNIGLPDTYYSSDYGFVARDNFAYVISPGSSNEGAVTRVNLTSGALTQFGSHRYSNLALDQAGLIHAYSNGKVYKYDPMTLTLLGEADIVSARQILFDRSDRLIALSNNNEIVRYDAQRLIDSRIRLDYWPRAMATNDRDELIVLMQNDQLVWYAADWQRSSSINFRGNRIESFPQVDSDADGLPDWWELRHGLAIADVSDAVLDVDGDGLSALEEYIVDTDPALDDTDGDLLNDGDEVNDYLTNPNIRDTDGDGLSDAEEAFQYLTNPRMIDSDKDLISDYLEVTHFKTDPNDAQSKPTPLANFVESFENSVTGWVTPGSGADAGWAQVSDFASTGTKSLRSQPIGNSQAAATEMTAFFNNSTLSFDARISSEGCCDHLFIFVDGEQTAYVRGDESNGQWITRSVPVPAGLHTIRFVYRKDGSGVTGADAAWIDNIRVQ